MNGKRKVDFHIVWTLGDVERKDVKDVEQPSSITNITYARVDRSEPSAQSGRCPTFGGGRNNKKSEEG